MTRRRTPQEKKLDEYTKDHFAYSESVHGFRKTWPRSKARANRVYRRQVHQVLTSLEAREQEDFPDDARPELVRRERLRKLGVYPFGEVIQRRLKERIERPLDNLLMRDYNSAVDREPFTLFFSAQIEGRSERSQHLVLYLKDLIDPFSRYPGKWDNRGREIKQQCLRAFFQDAPEWEERLRTWIASFEQE